MNITSQPPPHPGEFAAALHEEINEELDNDSNQLET
jgi:hypothetical protein